MFDDEPAIERKGLGNTPRARYIAKGSDARPRLKDRPEFREGERRKPPVDEFSRVAKRRTEGPPFLFLWP
jgi:hypothetical protein